MLFYSRWLIGGTSRGRPSASLQLARGNQRDKLASLWRRETSEWRLQGGLKEASQQDEALGGGGLSSGLALPNAHVGRHSALLAAWRAPREQNGSARK